MTVLYNCHHDGHDYRITKFVDGSPEGSYLCSVEACECPAGHRPTCRHRQMLLEFTSRHLVNSHLFWDFDNRQSCDFAGNPARETVPAEEDTEAKAWGTVLGRNVVAVHNGTPIIEVDELPAPEALHDTAEGLPSASLSIDDWRHAARVATVEITEQIVRTPLPPAKWRRL